MKHILLTTCLATLGLLPCQAVQHAENYEAAKSIVQDDGFILFAYAEDWDTYSKGVCDTLMASEAVIKAAENAVFMRLPIPNAMSDERREADKARYGELQFPPDRMNIPRSYPALLLFTKSGRLYATVEGPFMRKAAPKKVSELIQTYLKALHEQNDLLARAEKAKGVEKARLLAQAAEVAHISPPEPLTKYADTIAKFDPKDQTGYVRRFRRGPLSFMGEARELELSKEPNKGWEAAVELMETYLKDEAYTPQQKQEMHAVIVGLLRRHAGNRGKAKLREHLRTMESLDPESYMGRVAKIMIRDWGLGFNLIEGWNADIVKNDNEPVELEAPMPITQPGVYTFTFKHENGKDSCHIRAVSLYDGKKLVVEDRHNGTAGPKDSGNIYTLKVDSMPAEPHLFIEFEQKGKTDTQGHIIVNRG